MVQNDTWRGMRCLGIDYGEKRIGLSFSDELGVATPLPAVAGTAQGEPLKDLAGIIRGRRITALVLGHPLNMDGSAGFKAKEVERFAGELERAFGLPVHLVDERLTTYEAEQTIAKAGRRAVRRSGVVDSRAACLILQDFLNQHLPPAPPPEPSDHA
jgi:putative Holliday junction resolvase